MTTDESGKQNTGAGSSDPAAKEEAANASEGTGEERAGRMNAAKAFYRAMYAGEDVIPNDFGIGGAPGAAGGGPRDNGPCQNCAHLQKELEEAQQKATEMENLYKRMAADFENYRKRIDREREEFAGTGMQKAIEGILPALDDFERAKQTLNSSTDPKTILESVNLVFQRFMKCLENMGVKPLEVIGTPFDPRLHEPVQEIETKHFADGAVMHELRKGYEFRDKILRPTLVNVASNASGVVEPLPAPAAAPASAAPAAPTETTAESASAPEASASSADNESERRTKETADLPDLMESLNSLVSDSPSGEEPSQTATAAFLAKGRSKGEDEDKAQPVGAAKKKGANTGSGGKGHTETADLPVFEYTDTLTEVEEAEPSKEQKVYDISDTDTENS
ncbi:MAG TPA: nucleotide exchange factor GrpE [Planktothrix sp.]|jgi:molecular chaperone GrpE